LVTQTTGEVPASFVVTATDSARLQAQATTIGPAALIRTIDELASALTAVREGDDARMAVEIALLKAARPDLDPSTEGLLRRIERLEGQLSGAGGPRVLPQEQGGTAGEDAPDPPPAPPAAAPAPADDPEPEASDEGASLAGGVAGGDPRGAEDAEHPSTVGVPAATGPAGHSADSSVGDAAPTGPAGQGDLDLEKLKQIWPTILDRLGETAPALAAFFEEARPVGFDAAKGVIEISFPASATFNKRKAEVPEQRERVAEALLTVTGQSLQPAYVLLEGERPAPQASASGKEDEGIDEEELLRRLKSEFDAEEVS
jgi:DNA polymerase-3 subunit gamma/tau